jgi:hypothetical protein|tara:strand:+ start:155 stop:445 length:291 start_codon:yes stop_codon:yes gene_type:complete
MSFKLTRTSSKINPKLRRIQSELDKLPAQAAFKFKSVTPRRTGNARRKTVLKNKVIIANYHYATKLNEGYSKQAPRGMVEPTMAFIRQRVKQIMGK